jgi:hypothetical protein
MNWLDTETKAILHKASEPKRAPSRAAEFALVLVKKGLDRPRLIRAISRINECSEETAAELADRPVPVAINCDLSEEDAVYGQFELISCDSIGVLVRSEVLGQNEKDYIHALFGKILQSAEFKPVKVKVVEVPDTEPGQKFVDQFLGPATPGRKPVFPLSVEVPFKKARIMMHWATRVGANVQRDPA